MNRHGMAQCFFFEGGEGQRGFEEMWKLIQQNRQKRPFVETNPITNINTKLTPNLV